MWLLEFEALLDRIAIDGFIFEVAAAARLAFDVGELTHDVFRAREGMLRLCEGWDARNKIQYDARVVRKAGRCCTGKLGGGSTQDVNSLLVQ